MRTDLIADLRYALRQLRKAPGFTVTAVLSLALGIGISAAMFTVVDGVLLRPVPVPHPSEVVALGEANNAGKMGPSSLPNLRDWRARSKSFQDIAWYTEKYLDLKKTDGSAQSSVQVETSANFFSTLQAQPLMGRTFLPNRSAKGNAGTAVLSYFVWKNYFHGDKGIVGKTVDLGPDSYTVIGVMPPRFSIGLGADGPAVWTVLIPSPNMEQRDRSFLYGLGRLRRRVSVASVKAELSGIQSNIARQYKSEHLPREVTVENYRETLVGPVRPALLALMGAVLVVWLIACANVAGLVLTRVIARQREIAVRTALGASRRRIACQFLTESVLLGVFGGVCGLGVAYGCLVFFLRRSVQDHLNRSGDIGLNWHVVLLLIVLSIASGIFFGTVPAFHAASADSREVLHEGSVAAGTHTKQLRLRNALIVGELALSLVLLVAAGLLLRTLYALRAVHLGFNPEHLVTAQFLSNNGFMPFPEKTGADIRNTLYKPLLERVRHLSGVKSVALTTAAPLAGNVHFTTNFAVIGDPAANAAHRNVEIRAVTPEVYRTLGIRLLKGRLFNGLDRMGTPTVAVVNQAFAHQYLGGNPLGERLNLGSNPREKGVMRDVTVVGVVANTPQGTVSQPIAPQIDVDMNQIPVGDDFSAIFSLTMELVVRTEREPGVLIPALNRILSPLKTNFFVSSVQTMPQHIDDLLGSQRLAAHLLWLFAIVALLIAAEGLYGLLSYSVGQRTREIGVRVALGAQRGDILRLVLRQSARLLAAGLLLGILGAYFATRLVRGFLYGVHPHDAITIAAVCILLACVGLLASYIPARRAANIEPTEALRSE